MVRFSCSCGMVLEVGEDLRGRSVRCPDCGSVTQTQGAESVPADTRLTAARTAPPPLPPSSEERGDFHERVLPPPLPIAAQESPSYDTDLDHEIQSLGLVDHAGDPVAEDDDFFAAAPTEIGRVLSAHTTLKEHKQPWSWPARMAMLLPVLIGCLALLVILTIHRPLLSWLVLPVVIGWTLIVFALTRFSHTCNYVGTEGLAVFRCGGDRRRITRTDIFLFQDAMDLRTGQTNVYVNGVYSGTNYFFTWSNEDGRKVHSLSGRYWTRKDLPAVQHPFRYALAAEGAWTGYLSQNMNRHLLDRDGLLYFPLDKENWIRLGPGVIHMKIGGAETDLDSSRLDKVTMGQGIIFLFEVGGKEGWFSSTGIHKIVYKDLANARFFLFAFHKLLGYRLY